MTFEVGAVLEDAKWQAPVYCFEKMNDDGIGTEPKLKAQFVITRGFRDSSLDGVLRASLDLWIILWCTFLLLHVCISLEINLHFALENSRHAILADKPQGMSNPCLLEPYPMPLLGCNVPKVHPILINKYQDLPLFNWFLCCPFQLVLITYQLQKYIVYGNNLGVRSLC